jgi:hypothetical protein
MLRCHAVNYWQQLGGLHRGLSKIAAADTMLSCVYVVCQMQDLAVNLTRYWPGNIGIKVPAEAQQRAPPGPAEITPCDVFRLIRGRTMWIIGCVASSCGARSDLVWGQGGYGCRVVVLNATYFPCTHSQSRQH